MIVVCGLGLRSYPLGDSLWIDELHTAWTVSQGFSDVAPRAELGNNGPLYFHVVYGLTRLTGVHEWSLRLLSLCSGVGLVLASYALARSWNCSPQAALVAATLTAIDTNNLFFSCEARPYALVQVVGIGHLFCFWRLLTRQPGRREAFAWLLSGVVLFHLHCTTALLFFAEVAAFVVCYLSVREVVVLRLRELLCGMVLLALCALPAVGLLATVAQRRDNWQQFVHQQDFAATLTIYPLQAYLLVPAIAWMIYSLGTNTRSDGHESRVSARTKAALIVGGCWLCIPILCAWCLTETDVARLFFRRYLIGSSVVLAPLSALLLSSCRSRRLATVGALVTVMVALWSISPLKHTRQGYRALSHSGEDWRGAIAQMAASPQSQPVILRSGLIEADLWHDSEKPQEREYCLFPLRSMYHLPGAHRLVVTLPTTQDGSVYFGSTIAVARASEPVVADPRGRRDLSTRPGRGTRCAGKR